MLANRRYHDACLGLWIPAKHPCLMIWPTRVTSRAWLFLLQVVASPEVRTAT